MRLASVLLRRWREGAQINKLDASKAIGISQAMYWELESPEGKKLPGVRIAFAIERASGLAVPAWSWLVPIADEREATRALARESRLRKAA